MASLSSRNVLLILLFASVLISGQTPPVPTPSPGPNPNPPTNPIPVLTVGGPRYLLLGTLAGADAAKAHAVGNRLTVLGKERQILSGSVTEQNGTVALAATVTTETNGNLRVDFPAGQGSIVSNGASTTTNGANLTVTDTDIVESIGEDSADAFLFNRAGGFPVRRLGIFASLPDPNPKNPASTCELVQMWLPTSATTKAFTRLKKYCFDAGTHLLTAVLYRLEPSGTQVETRYTGWTTVSGQAVPANITRRENGTVIFSFQIQSATFAQYAADNLFAPLSGVTTH